MNRKLILLNLLLAGLAAALGWQVRRHWLDSAAHQRSIFEQAARVKAQVPPPAIAAPGPIAPVEYMEVAQKTLFSKDRNPNVIIDAPPPPPKPETPMPALPLYHGQMALGDPVIVFSPDVSTPQKSYHAGEKVGPFEIVSFDRDQVTFTWDGKTVERKLKDLAPKDNAAPQQTQQRPAASSSAPSTVTSLSGNSDKPAAKDSVKGVALGGDFYACAAGDNLPTGTVKDGYKKILSSSPFGQNCHWERVQ